MEGAVDVASGVFVVPAGNQVVYRLGSAVAARAHLGAILHPLAASFVHGKPSTPELEHTALVWFWERQKDTGESASIEVVNVPLGPIEAFLPVCFNTGGGTDYLQPFV